MAMVRGLAGTPYNFPTRDDAALPRLVAAGATGVATGLLGINVARAGLLFGILLAVAQTGEGSEIHIRGVPGHVVDGVLDGSAAIIARRIIMGAGF